MVDLAAVAAGLNSLKVAGEIVKGLNATNTLVAINDVKLSLQESIFEARDAMETLREAHASALQRIRELEEEIMRLKDWEADKQRYELMDLRRGFYAYVPKAGMENGEPPHGLCATCYQRRQKSLLTSNGNFFASDHAWVCQNCKSVFPSSWGDLGEAIAEVRRR